MANNEGKVIFTGDAKELLAEYEKLRKEQDKQTDSYKRTKKASQEAAREAAKLGKEAADALAKTRSPAENYLAQLNRMKQALEAGKISQAEFDRIRQRQLGILNALKQAERENTEEYKAQQQAIKATAQEQEEYGRKGKSVYESTRTSLERYNAKVYELTDLKKRGVITQETYNRALSKERAAYHQAVDGQAGYRKGLTSIAGYIGVGGLIMSGFSMWKQANREIIEQANEIASKYDEVAKKFKVQSGLRGLDGARAQAKVADISEEVALPGGLNQGLEAATELVSSDFSVEEATGGSLRAFLQTLAAGGAQGRNVDPAELAKSFSQYLHAQGMAKNEESVRFLGQSSNALMKATKFDIGQLTSLAKESGAMKSAATPSQQLATFAELGMSQEAPQAAVGMRNFFGRLQTASAFPERMKVLEQLNLGAEDVDFVGEDMNAVIPRLNEAFGKVDESKRAGLMARLFGEETVPVATLIMENLGRIQQHQVDMANSDTFAADVKTATTGRASAEARQNIANQRDMLQRDEQDNLMSTELGLMLRERGASPFVQTKAQAYYSMSRSMGADVDSAIQWATPYAYNKDTARAWYGSASEGANVADEMSISPERIRQRVNARSGSDLSQETAELKQAFSEVKTALDRNTDATLKNNQETAKNSNVNGKNSGATGRSGPPSAQLSAENRR